MILTRVLAILALCALTVQRADAQTPLPDLAEVCSTGLPGSFPVVDAGFTAFMVDEAYHGHQNLNSDGDQEDEVLFVHDAVTGKTVNVGFALKNPLLSMGAGVLVFSASEQENGGLDMNGDGDAVDQVLHGWDLVGETTLNLGLVYSSALLFEEGILVFDVQEGSNGMSDRNGDGDASDTVFHAHDAIQGITRNLGLDGTLPWLYGSRYLMVVPESSQGASDLNGDGDSEDRVLFEHDFATGATQNLGLAASAGGVEEGLLTIRVGENQHGKTDLNGDGDTYDSIVYAVEPRFPFGLTTDGDALSVSRGGAQRLELDAGSARGGELYVLLGSLSGTSPGLPLGAISLPLNVDGYFLLTLEAPNTPPLSGFVGVLSSMGEAQASFTLPAGSPASLVGLSAHHAYVALDIPAAALTLVSNPTPLHFVH